MPKLRSAVIFTICLTLLASAGSVFAGGRGQRTPIRFAPNSLDQQPVTAVNPLDGSVWTAWAWRDGAEYSIALSIQSEGVWSEPFFIGRDDNLNQVSPAIVFDDRGVAYLAWTVLPESQVMIVAIAESPQAGLNLRTVSTRNIPSTEPALAVVRGRHRSEHGAVSCARSYLRSRWRLRHRFHRNRFDRRDCEHARSSVLTPPRLPPKLLRRV